MASLFPREGLTGAVLEKHLSAFWSPLEFLLPGAVGLTLRRYGPGWRVSSRMVSRAPPNVLVP